MWTLPDTMHITARSGLTVSFLSAGRVLPRLAYQVAEQPMQPGFGSVDPGSLVDVCRSPAGLALIRRRLVVADFVAAALLFCSIIVVIVHRAEREECAPGSERVR